jgi:hypothetical protein
VKACCGHRISRAHREPFSDFSSRRSRTQLSGINPIRLAFDLLVRIEVQGNLVRVQIWNAEIGCPNPDEWSSFPVASFSGNTFTTRGHDVDDQRPAVDCVSTWDSVFSYTFADPAISGSLLPDLSADDGL